MSSDLLKVKNLTKIFFHNKTKEIAVNDVSFSLKRSQITGLIGISGCGKTTLAKLLLNLLLPTSGEVLYNNKNIFSLSSKEMRKLRQKIQILFQNPYSSLNPRMIIKDILQEPLIIHKFGSKKEISQRVLTLLDCVSLPKKSLSKFPHEFSGGQRQRIALARAIALNPYFLILDEPTSALDISLQSQMITLLKNIKQQFHLSYLFITHNFALIKNFCDRVMVMHEGKIVENNTTQDLFSSPTHFQTKKLLLATKPSFSNKDLLSKLLNKQLVP